LFGNFGFFAIHAQYRLAVGSLERMDLATKLAFLFGRVLILPGNFLLLFAWLSYGVIGAGIASWRAGRLHFDSLLAGLLVISLAASGLVPSPVFAQYFYDLAPFAVIGIALGLSRLLCWFSSSTRPARSAARLALVGSFVALVVVANVDSIPDYWQLRQVTQRSNWTPLQLHGLGYRIRQQVRSGPVFTLSPLYVLEGGLEIYPSMATGPFIWRAAVLIPQAERQKYHVLDPQDLPALFATQPPAAILVGEERELEISLVDYARQNGYTLTPVAESLRLWLKDPIKK
jgi:hypothetical protein